MAISTTADSEDVILQPRVVFGDDPYGLFTIEDSKKPGKDEEKKACHRLCCYSSTDVDGRL